MKALVYILSIFLLFGCNDEKIKLNNKVITFDSFEENKQLKFSILSENITDLPSKMLLHDNNLIIETIYHSTGYHLLIFSLDKNEITNEIIKYGEGPEEFMSCDIYPQENNLWLYDISKRQIGTIPIDSVSSELSYIKKYKLNRYYYRIAMLNDSIMLGTNNLESRKKISYVNLLTGKTEEKGDYAYLDESIDLDVLIDASSCYIDVNPKTKDILLSYRYTDVIEIYNKKGELKYSLQGPESFNIEFQPRQRGMGKTKDTRKAYVNSYVTEENIYLLYSGCKRQDKNWSNGMELFVFSWDGKPLKRYTLEEPIYAFAIDEKEQLLYSYSLETENLIVAKLD